MTLSGAPSTLLSLIKSPLQLSLSLPEPYNQFLQPIIHEEATHVQNLVIRNLSDSAPISTAILLPTFLPLPSTFDHYNKESWVELHKGIAHWMSTLIERKNHSQDWEWGREAYWMAFAAAYTNFPNHSWPSWDTTIELDGPFILGWFYGECNSTDENMDDSEEDSDDSDMGTWGRDREVRKNIWQRFRMHVWAGRSIFI
ncbi:hypothetical protein E1B28_007364 [Marasmius oreades]|uniref:Uncharacterized protein n=1 Tax=Marasmius oreades TaxID=181124 RepID=A0A9P7UTY6_9AGAR|nr:uncharacterized protein E1B28_007364 [Marasmius oreades]KAG7093710.1 hypothetical protein E1B28_007364 [Marasmius oreades]